MEPVTVNCPQCETRLQPPPDRKRIVCPRCGAAIEVPGAAPGPEVTGNRQQSRDWEPEEVIRTRLAELDESIELLESEIEAVRSRELSGPLQLGCSFFGLFMALILVLVAFMLLGRDYFGSWIFYVCVTAVLLAGVARIRRTLKQRIGAGELRRERLDLEKQLAHLQDEHKRVERLRADLLSEDQPADSNHPS